MRPTRRVRKTGLHNNPAPDYLQIQDFGEKGRGIVATKFIPEGSFVVLFVGKKTFHEPQGDDTYVYEIQQKRKIWFDATSDDQSYGRLINDNHLTPNLKVKLVNIDGEDAPGFFALIDIDAGEEITYNYGGGDYSWRKTKPSKKKQTDDDNVDDEVVDDDVVDGDNVDDDVFDDDVVDDDVVDDDVFDDDVFDDEVVDDDIVDDDIVDDDVVDNDVFDDVVDDNVFDDDVVDDNVFDDDVENDVVVDDRVVNDEVVDDKVVDDDVVDDDVVENDVVDDKVVDDDVVDNDVVDDEVVDDEVVDDNVVDDEVVIVIDNDVVDDEVVDDEVIDDDVVDDEVVDDEVVDNSGDSDGLSDIVPIYPALCRADEEDTEQTSNKVDQSLQERAQSSSRIYVTTSKKKEDGSRIWDKKHSCVYCSKQYPKLPRHLQQKHYNELEVQRALAYDKGSKERKDIWKELTLKGDFRHNTKVFEEGNGEIIPCKRPRSEKDGASYVQCKQCLGTFLSSDLWRHVKNMHPTDNKVKRSTKHHQVDSASLMPVSPAAREEFRNKILDKLCNDSVSMIARTDCDIVVFGQRKFIKHIRNVHYYEHVRQQMRELARFVQSARTVDSSISSLRDCVDPLKFNVCVSTVKKLCGYNESSLEYEIPSLAKKVGHSLHKVARKVRTDAMARGDKSLEAKAERFIEVFREEWEIEVSHAALETLEIKKYNKSSRIPLAEDLKALSLYLKEKADAIMAKSEISELEWRDLNEISLAQIVLFNKRRGGEAQRLEVQQYISGIQNGKTTQSEVMESLSPLERELTKVMSRVEIRGKRGRRVAILLPQDLKRQLDILLNHRSCCNIATENIFMFARPGDSETPIRATDVLRKFAALCGAKEPETLTSTGFRKHVATISQMLNLKENELDILAGFLGHDIRVHREFYRLPQDTMQIAKVSKLLLELERGNIAAYKGKSLDEMQFDLNEPLEYEAEEVEPEVVHTSPEIEPVERVRQTNPQRESKKRIPWTEREKEAVKRQLERYFFLDRLPGKHEIVEAQKKESILQKRPWAQIKFFIKNSKVSKKGK